MEQDGVDRIWEQHLGEGPVLAMAVHDGHGVREEVASLLALGDEDRLREEDPFTGQWAAIASSRVVGTRSRFEVDLNRPRETAVYRSPEDAWGLHVWRSDPPDDLVERSLAEYDLFFSSMEPILDDLERRHGRFVVLDLHSYNHRRAGPGGPQADPRTNPQVNLGTGSMDRQRWGRLVDRFMADLRAFEFPEGHLDVRENVKFRGRQVAGWVHERYPTSGCALAIEIKKFFMDEWTGEPHPQLLPAVADALASTLAGLVESLEEG